MSEIQIGDLFRQNSFENCVLLRSKLNLIRTQLWANQNGTREVYICPNEAL